MKTRIDAVLFSLIKDRLNYLKIEGMNCMMLNQTRNKCQIRSISLIKSFRKLISHNKEFNKPNLNMTILLNLSLTFMIQNNKGL